MALEINVQLHDTYIHLNMEHARPGTSSYIRQAVGQLVQIGFSTFIMPRAKIGALEAVLAELIMHRALKKRNVSSISWD